MRPVVDVRHEPTGLDCDLHDWLAFHRKPNIVVATKSDKLSSNQLRKNVAEIANELEGSALIAYSSRLGSGRDAVLDAIGKAANNFAK